MAKVVVTADGLVADLPAGMRETAEALRAVLRKKSLGLEEGVKWNAPSYTFWG